MTQQGFGIETLGDASTMGTARSDSGSLIHTVIDHFRANLDTLTDRTKVGSGQWFLTAGELVVEAAVGAATIYGLNRFGAGRLLGGEKTISTGLAETRGGMSLAGLPDPDAEMFSAVPKLSDYAAGLRKGGPITMTARGWDSVNGVKLGDVVGPYTPIRFRPDRSPVTFFDPSRETVFTVEPTALTPAQRTIFTPGESAPIAVRFPDQADPIFSAVPKLADYAGGMRKGGPVSMTARGWDTVNGVKLRDVVGPYTPIRLRPEASPVTFFDAASKTLFGVKREALSPRQLNTFYPFSEIDFVAGS